MDTITDINTIASLMLPVVGIVLAIVLIWMAFEIIRAVRRSRKTITALQDRFASTLENANVTLGNINEITESLKPVAAKIDPLVERVSLTVDAANLELMRVDHILEDVAEVTSGMTDAVNAIDAVASAPRDIAANVSNRLRDAFKSRRASDESIALGERRAQQTQQGQQGQGDYAIDSAIAESASPADVSTFLTSDQS